MPFFAAIISESVARSLASLFAHIPTTLKIPPSDCLSEPLLTSLRGALRRTLRRSLVVREKKRLYAPPVIVQRDICDIFIWGKKGQPSSYRIPHQHRIVTQLLFHAIYSPCRPFKCVRACLGTFRALQHFQIIKSCLLLFYVIKTRPLYPWLDSPHHRS